MRVLMWVVRARDCVAGGDKGQQEIMVPCRSFRIAATITGQFGNSRAVVAMGTELFVDTDRGVFPVICDADVLSLPVKWRLALTSRRNASSCRFPSR